MSEKQASEYLKRTCLICGCHTNQTINIYEPRSGPNIVKLIQAKFKFQPLNEDKYLCFSCNNWLINWHSLQALNSNDAESPSGTFRSNVNPVVHDKAPRQVAVVRPQMKEPQAMAVESPRKPAEPTVLSCGMCGRAIVLKGNATHSLCLKCREVRKLRAINHSQLKRQRVRPRRSVQSKQSEEKLVTKAIPATPKPIEVRPAAEATPSLLEAKRPLPRRPLVDGKVVSMLRRLGTTLSRENQSNGCQLPVLMQVVEPAQAPRWTRPLDADEILLDFNAAISEVLPSARAHRNAENVDPARKTNERIDFTPHLNHNHNKSYRMSWGEAELPKDICSMLPKGLSVALISH